VLGHFVDKAGINQGSSRISQRRLAYVYASYLMLEGVSKQ
jgi:hypothetical protein